MEKLWSCLVPFDEINFADESGLPDIRRGTHLGSRERLERPIDLRPTNKSVA
jgi:hypothetical protein